MLTSSKSIVSIPFPSAIVSKIETYSNRYSLDFNVYELSFSLGISNKEDNTESLPNNAWNVSASPNSSSPAK